MREEDLVFSVVNYAVVLQFVALGVVDGYLLILQGRLLLLLPQRFDFLSVPNTEEDLFQGSDTDAVRPDAKCIEVFVEFLKELLEQH